MKSIRLIFFLTLAAFVAPIISANASPPQSLRSEAPDLKDTCLIIGTVIKVERRLDAPYNSTPSIFNDSYQRLTVRIKEVQIHEKYYNKHVSECDRFTVGEDAYFKLCSENKPRPGHTISGIAATPITNKNQAACLFDIKNAGKK